MQDLRSLGIVSAMRASRDAAGVHVHLSFGRVIDRLAARFRQLYLCVPLWEGPPDEMRDYRLAAPNVELIPQPAYGTSLGALRHPRGICSAYRQLCERAELVFVRGFLPFAGQFYAAARRLGRRPCQWIVGDPLALLRSHRRAGSWYDLGSYLYAWQNQQWTRRGVRLTRGAYVCNGEALGAQFPSARTMVTVSSTITDDEFFAREDSCTSPTVQLLFIGILRPEKGVQYLIEAVSLLNLPRPWHLTIVGASDHFPEYRGALERTARELGVLERITWTGYVTYGPAMFAQLRNADIFVLPTLSEGTPRVLVEARANGLPVVATRVGGIPTSVRDGFDGLLVPPKDPRAIAAALERIIADGALRRSLIRNGLASARQLTVDRFAERVAAIMTSTE